MNDSGDHNTIDLLCSDIIAADSNTECYKKYEDNSDGNVHTSKIKTILDKVFYSLIAVTMFLCFFSLCASVTANLYE